MHTFLFVRSVCSAIRRDCIMNAIIPINVRPSPAFPFPPPPVSQSCHSYLTTPHLTLSYDFQSGNTLGHSRTPNLGRLRPHRHAPPHILPGSTAAVNSRRYRLASRRARPSSVALRVNSAAHLVSGFLQVIIHFFLPVWCIRPRPLLNFQRT